MDSEYNTYNTTDIKPELPSPYPNLKQSWSLFAMFLVFSLGAGALFSPLSKIKYDLIGSIVSLLSYVLTFVLLFVYVKFQQNTRQQKIEIKLAKVPIIVFILLLFIAPLLSIVIEPLMWWLPMPEWFKKLMGEMVKPDVVSFLSVVIAAPICEEIFCRGIILEGLLRNKIKPTNAILWSSLLFAALHMNPWQGVPAFALGCLMGWVYYKTRSLWPAIFIHFVNNGLAFILLIIYPDPNMTTQELFDGKYFMVYIGALIAVIILGTMLYRYFNSRKSEDKI